MHGLELVIHWHGLHQRGTQYYDGVPYVTQCPIHEGNSFRYQFDTNAGTHFWHAHSGKRRFRNYNLSANQLFSLFHGRSGTMIFMTLAVPALNLDSFGFICDFLIRKQKLWRYKTKFQTQSVSIILQKKLFSTNQSQKKITFRKHTKYDIRRLLLTCENSLNVKRIFLKHI